MEAKLYLDISPQPDGVTCGPTCLHAIYRYFDDAISLQQIISEVPQIEGGGTLSVYLAGHALRRGYRATIFTYNLQIFDPTWANASSPMIAQKLRMQAFHKKDIPGLEEATEAFLEYLALGGRLRFEVLTAGLIRRHLKRSLPLLTGLSGTYLHNTAREYDDGTKMVFDDVRGESAGHFVVLAGYNRQDRSVLVADPLMPNPVAASQFYHVNIFRLVCAIMLGTLTFDGDILIIEPSAAGKRQSPWPLKRVK
jgi:hypothetical protein